MKKITTIFFVFLFIFLLPFFFMEGIAHAQSWGDGDKWRSYEGADIDYDEVKEWRSRSNRISEAIDDLDNDPVEEVPIPVLFGVAVNDLTPNFGDPRDGGARIHEGLDMLAPLGTPIVSPTEAVVVRISEGSNSGHYVTTANPGGETFIYMHLDEVADIDVGDELNRGDLIGYVGNTGNAVGGSHHLHFEIRDGRDEMDPLPRLSTMFSLEEKMGFLDEMFDDVSDEDEFATRLFTDFREVFLEAQREGIDLPDEIDDLMPQTVSAPSDIPVRDLTVGSEGIDVSTLQGILMNTGHLSITAPTGYFGELTRSALASYQRVNGIEPASGYFGPITRSFMQRVISPDMTRDELIEEIKRLSELVDELREQLERSNN